MRRLARLGGPGGASFEEGLTARPLQGLSARRYAWADLLRRVFVVEVLECPRCGGPMRILAAIHPPEASRAILQCLDLPSRAPPAAPARPQPVRSHPAPPDW